MTDFLRLEVNWTCVVIYDDCKEGLYNILKLWLIRCVCAGPEEP